MKRCVILMATYNGEEYIERQIQSICSQSYSSWELIIRDDGSSDNTVSIIKRFVNQDARIKLIHNESTVHGAYINFWELISYAKKLEKYEYYFFADQDDIWLNDKIKEFINLADKYNNVPLYIYSDMAIIDAMDNITLRSINQTMGITMGKDRRTLFYSQGYVWGCASMINRALFERVSIPMSYEKETNILSHDNYYAKHALILGKVLFVNKPLINHRRHASNTTGVYSMKLTPMVILKKGLFSLKETAKTHALGYDQTLYTIDRMMDSGIDDAELLLIKNSILRGGVAGVVQMLKFKVRRPQFFRTIGIYVVMFFKLYYSYMQYGKKNNECCDNNCQWLR